MSTTESKKEKKWFPLESNPILMNKYITKLGFDASKYEFVDVFSTEDWALAMIPQPAVAVIMLFPVTEAQEAHRKAEKSERGDTDVWFVKQRIGNACGTVGLLHAIGNLPEGVKLDAIKGESWLETFLFECPPSLDPVKKAEILEASDTLESLHDQATTDSTSQTNRGNIDDNVDNHFVAFVHKNGGLYELDGRKEGPIRHGDTNEMNLLKDACGVVKEFMNRDPGEMRFTILAMAPKAEA